MSSQLDKANKYLTDRGYDPTAGFVNSGGGVRNFAPKQTASATSFFRNIKKSASGVPGAALSFAKSLAKPVIDTARFGGATLSSIQNAGIAKKAAAKQQQFRDQTHADFKSGKISAKEYSRRLNAIESNKNAKTLKSINEQGTKDTKEFTTKKVATDYAKTAVTALTVAAPFATAVAPVAEGAGLLARGGNLAARGVDAYFGAGNMIKPGSVPASVGRSLMKVGGMGLDIAANQSTIQDLSQGKIDPINAGLTAAGFVPGGAVGLAEKYGSKATSAATRALYSKQGIFDKIAIKGGSVLSQVDKIADPKTKSKVEGVLKQYQDFLLQQHGTPRSAVKAFEEYVGNHADMSLPEVVKELSGFMAAQKVAQTAQKAITTGGRKVLQGDKDVAELLAKKGGQIRAGKFSGNDAKSLSKIINEEADGAKALARIKTELPQVMDNARNREIITTALTGGEKIDIAKLQSQLVKTTPLIDKATGKPIMQNGYHLFYTPKEYATFKKAGEVPAIIRSSKAKLAPVGEALDKVGLSTKAANPQEQKAMFRRVRDEFVKRMDGSAIMANGEVISGKTILNKLNDAVMKRLGMTDIRQLSWKTVAKEVGVNDAAAKKIVKEYKDSFFTLSTAERGLAGKVQDLNLKYNPIAGAYSRAQSVARYEVPWFRVQENIETKLGVAAVTGANAVPRRDYTDTIDAMKNSGLLRGAGFGGEGAGEFGNITAKLSRSQERNLAAGLESLAGTKDKIQITKFIKENPKLMENLRTVVQYPDKGLTSSNLMKALNLVAFPVRYNLKVTQFALKELGKYHGARQLAVLGGYRNFQNWLKTPEGIKWESDNKEALGVIRYFTPIGSIDSTYKLLTGDVHNLRDIGSIGGLPLGFITAALQGQGIIQTDSPYLDPKTGEVTSTKIPEDLKARASQALSDIIGTMWTFPGRTINAPSKKSLNEKAAEAVSLGTLKGGKFNSVTRTDLTPQQRKQQAVLQAGKAKTTLSVPKSSEGVKPLTSSKNPNDYIKPIYKGKGKKAKSKATPLRRPR